MGTADNPNESGDTALDLSAYPSSLRHILLETEKAEKERHKYFYTCAFQRLCHSTQEALLKHWEYPVFRFGDDRGDYLIDENFCDFPLCPPPYAMITRAMFNNDLSRKAPFGLDTHVLKTVSNLDKYGLNYI